MYKQGDIILVYINMSLLSRIAIVIESEKHLNLQPLERNIVGAIVSSSISSNRLRVTMEGIKENQYLYTEHFLKNQKTDWKILEKPFLITEKEYTYKNLNKLKKYIK